MATAPCNMHLVAPVCSPSNQLVRTTARPTLFRPGTLHICYAVAEPATLETVQKVIATQLSMNEDNVKPESKFADLGADSLDTVEIMMNLEESFNISLGEEGAEKIATVQDAADIIETMLSKSS